MRKASNKPNKPYSEYPFFAHEMVNGPRKYAEGPYYFGVWADPQGAVNKFLDDKDHLDNDRTPPLTGHNRC